MSTPKTKRNEQIIALLRSGFTQLEAGRAFGLTKQRISMIALAHGIRRGANNAYEPVMINDARMMWDHGLSASEIAANLQIRYRRLFTKNMVIGIAHRNHFPARPSPLKRAA